MIFEGKWPRSGKIPTSAFSRQVSLPDETHVPVGWHLDSTVTSANRHAIDQQHDHGAEERHDEAGALIGAIHAEGAADESADWAATGDTARTELRRTRATRIGRMRGLRGHGAKVTPV